MARLIERALASVLARIRKEYPVIAIMGPRQSGKTTLAQLVFHDYEYVSFEDLDVRTFAKSDPRAFLDTYMGKRGVIFDEVQHVPDIFSYLQTLVDREKKFGYFVLTGSQNFLLNERISQTLAGRVAITTLLPFSCAELLQANVLPDQVETAMFRGMYPRIWAHDMEPARWYKNYIQTYVERDVRQIKSITDLEMFTRFVQLCAGRIGQVLNISSLANDCGISSNTAKSWLSVLQASYLVFLLQPYYKNFSKRLIKSPKIYFYDTGLACSLLGIDEPSQLPMHYLRGGLFESFILAELFKYYYNADRSPRLYFWRDKAGNEIDCIIDQPPHMIPVEIKAGKTISRAYFSGLEYWRTITKSEPTEAFVVYAGDEKQKRTKGTVINWQSVSDIF